MSTKELEVRLKERNIRPTAVRLLVLREMMSMEEHQAFSLLDLENRLDTVDKSTLYRTITHFHENLLIHSIDDGSGSIKYSVCRRGCDCSVPQSHVHFSCTECNRTFCLDNIAIPKVGLPSGFSYESANFVFKGICSDCSKRHN
ncbi:putative transcriptional regulator [Bacteroides coprosuis DSM 18011]|uniref:Putative transcriptional regulator n=2 Tax=Bacteroides TaxID=816 RepID=F3ZT40_9BACE|nr:putative transcriptional regulator [Bacteroides coprosuis DSM 18011]